MARHSLGASFRDPSGFVFQRDGTIFRQINRSYADDFQHLVGSGLYQELVDAGLLVAHQEVTVAPSEPEIAHTVIQPEQVPFISYPYEWCFSQLKDAALLQLRVQEMALRHGMTLKDCSAFNVQFLRGKPVLIDTLSFERYREGTPWVAYRQFCQHFLAPLALMSYTDVRLSQLLRIHIDGIPLDLASKLLPGRTRLVPSIAMHIHLHASSQKRYAARPTASSAGRLQMSRTNLEALLDSLKSAVNRLTWRWKDEGWIQYYAELQNYASTTSQQKQQVVAEFIDRVRPSSVWDLGANTGAYSRIASRGGIDTVSFDFDPGCIEAGYQTARSDREQHLLPLVMDLANPSPAIGWNLDERMSLIERGPADMVLALALMHHLVIGNNVPFSHLADFLSRIARTLVIEYVPKSDNQVQRLLASRRDIFDEFTQATFEEELGRHFAFQQPKALANSGRLLYLLEKHHTCPRPC